MRRVWPLVCLIVPLALAPDASAQDARVWTSDMVQAMHALGANDYAAAEQIFLKAVHEAESFPASDARRGSTLNALGLV